MAASEYYAHGAYPPQGSFGSSSGLRAELEAIESGISAKLPDLSGNGGKLVRVNAGATGLEATAVTIPASGTLATLGGNESFTGTKLFTTKFGYGDALTGGSVTQTGSKSAGVTLDKPCGTIASHAASLAANTRVSFLLTNSTIGQYDQVMAKRRQDGTNDAYLVYCDAHTVGSARITIWNLTGGPLAESIEIVFNVIAGRNS